MTKLERAKVVELLRCAADIGLQGCSWALTQACMRLGYGNRSKVAARADLAIVEMTTPTGDPDATWTNFGTNCLEAAARVEEGTWP